MERIDLLPAKHRRRSFIFFELGNRETDHTTHHFDQEGSTLKHHCYLVYFFVDCFIVLIRWLPPRFFWFSLF
jgi:hypothetical protein